IRRFAGYSRSPALHRNHALEAFEIICHCLGKGRRYASRGAAGQIIGNWNVTGIWSMATGEKFTPTAAAAVSNSAGGGGDRPNRIGNGNLPVGERTTDRWFDLSAFTAAQQFTFGNAGRGFLVAPGSFNVDLGIQREFPLGER